MSDTIQNAFGHGQRFENGLEALCENAAFHGPVDPLEGHEHANDHLALIYESREEQFAAACPFIDQGLELGERCVYITEENTPAEVRDAMRSHGIDVASALESGQLSIHTERETYRRLGWFDPDDTLAFLDEAITEANEAFEGLRVTGEMGWVLGDEPDVEDLVKCEGKANYLFADVDGMALCQYNRERFPPEVIRDVISTHPHLVHGNRVSNNSYYTPPSEFFGPDRPDKEVDRQLGTLREQTNAKVTLEESEQSLREQHEITAAPDRSFETKLQALLELGCERFDLELGAMARIDPEADAFELEYVSDDHDQFVPGATLPLSETYCSTTAESDGIIALEETAALGYTGRTVYSDYGFESYLGTVVEIDGGPTRTLFFVGTEPRTQQFSDDERTFHRLMGQWVKYELERHQRERELERTVDRLETSNERLEQFAYAASHDLQEPLRMVSSYLQLIDARASEELTVETREFLEYAVDGADRMRAMIDGLLTYSRIETRGDPLEAVDLDDVLEDVRADFRTQLEESDADVTVESLPRVEGDENQLRQVFQNLLENAIKYSGDKPPRIRVDAERDGPNWVVSISDDGIGIDPADSQRVFELFDRLHSREEYAGNGIGLALCQRIVERHSGSIWIDTEKTDGTTVSFTLPPASDVTNRLPKDGT